MLSPCRRTCTLHEPTRSCSSCGRTLAEISGWTNFTDEQRRQILRELPDRLAKLREDTP